MYKPSNIAQFLWITLPSYVRYHVTLERVIYGQDCIDQLCLYCCGFGIRRCIMEVNPSLTYWYRGPIYWHCVTLNPAWISDYTRYKAWDEISYLLPNFNGWTVEVWVWMNNIIPHFTRHMITFACWDFSYSMLVKGTPGDVYMRR